MTTKHTPGPLKDDSQITAGPWAAEEYINGKMVICGGKSNAPFIELLGGTYADLRLIVAAPELLEALANFREWYANHFEDFDSETNAQLLCLDNEARAAIDKATGDA